MKKLIQAIKNTGKGFKWYPETRTLILFFECGTGKEKYGLIAKYEDCGVRKKNSELRKGIKAIAEARTEEATVTRPIHPLTYWIKYGLP